MAVIVCDSSGRVLRDPDIQKQASPILNDEMQNECGCMDSSAVTRG